MKKVCLFSAAVCCVAAFAAVPVIAPDSVTMTQDSLRMVTINYTLADAPAIVTVDIRTNGVSIGRANLQYMKGDVNKRVEPGAHSLTWRPDKAWPDHKIDEGVTAAVTAWALETPPDYMVLSLVTSKGAEDIRYYESADELPSGGVTNSIYKTEQLVMRKIPAANVLWRMGKPASEASDHPGREIPHYVTLTNDYYMGVYQFTVLQYYYVTGGERTEAIDAFARGEYPVRAIGYNELRPTDWPNSGSDVGKGILDKIRTQTGVNTIDLPTDAQWEFACRAGCGAAYYNGSDISKTELDKLAWYTENNGGDIHPVGLKEPNTWGLYDMLGNVWEWCLDWLVLDASTVDSNTGPTSGSVRVTRGGGYGSYERTAKCAFRGDEDPTSGYSTVGFRICCPANRADPVVEE